MDEQNTPPSGHSGPGDSTADKRHAATRRRLLKGGLSAAPVAMTLASRPVLAGGVPGTCTTPSGFTSINLKSRPDKSASTCSGRTPGYWKQSQWFGQWPTPYYPVTGMYNGVRQSATTFGSAFGTATGTFDSKTMLAVLGLEGGGDIELARHITAALLNAAAGLTPVLTVSAVKTIWREYITKGYFEPTAGVRWNSVQITDYLKTTMPV